MKWSATIFPPANKSSTEELTALSPPKDLRTDFGLDVAMLADPTQDALQPGNDGLIRLRAGARVKFRIKVAQEAYVGIWSVNADGTVEQLFPNRDEPDHRFHKHVEQVVPQTNAVAVPSKANGKDWVWVQASTEPWKPDEGRRKGPFLLFETLQERDQWAQRRRGITLDLGVKLSETVLTFRVER
jgi:hypothetical protein